jgi:hypothetical protein
LTTVREIRILKALKYANVVPLLDMVVHPGELSFLLSRN